MLPWQRSLTWILGLKVIRVASSQFGGMSTFSLTLGRKEAVGDGSHDVLQSTTSSPSSYLLCTLVHLQGFQISEEALLPVGWCLIWLKDTIFGLGAGLYYSKLSYVLTLRLLWLIIPLSRRSWMSY